VLLNVAGNPRFRLRIHPDSVPSQGESDAIVITPGRFVKRNFDLVAPMLSRPVEPGEAGDAGRASGDPPGLARARQYQRAVPVCCVEPLLSVPCLTM
jgi:hypothetical protein